MLMQVTIVDDQATLHYESGREEIVNVNDLPKTAQRVIKTGKRYHIGTLVEWYINRRYKI